MRQQHGLKACKSDKLSGYLVGSAEKIAPNFLLLGHDEVVWLGTEYDLDPDIVVKHTEWLAAGGDGILHNPDGSVMVNEEGQIVLDQGPLGEGNGVYNAIVDNVKDAYVIQEGFMATAADINGHAAAGVAAGAVGYVTIRTGHAGRELVDSTKRQ